jgi:pimeloyl-ACP methyl ester carboxylesterase
VRQGMPDIGTLVEFGPRLKVQLGALELPLAGVGKLQAQFPLRGVFDLSDRFASRGLAFEPELSWVTRTAGGIGWGVNVGALIGSERLADTFYQVAPAYARLGRPAYDAKAGLISLRAGISGGYRVAPDWFVFAFARVDSVAGAKNRGRLTEALAPSAWFDGFVRADFDVGGGQTIHARTGGRADAPPLLLLHGFPQTHTMWHRVARQLAPDFKLVLADLPGYGDSTKPADSADHAAQSKRTMAAKLHALMRSLGHSRYAVCGHDRGGRVAARLALDQPAAVQRLAVIDIAPTLDMYAATTMDFARHYYHWFHLIQAAPLPEHMINGDAIGYLHTKLGRWGGTGWRMSSPKRWPSTNAAGPTRPPCTPPATTTAPAPASTLNTTVPAAASTNASAATCWCCGASAAWSANCSTRPRCGGHSARHASGRCAWQPGTTSLKKSRQKRPLHWRISSHADGVARLRLRCRPNRGAPRPKPLCPFEPPRCC